MAKSARSVKRPSRKTSKTDTLVVTMRIRRDIWAKVKRLAVQNHRPLSGQVSYMLETLLEKGTGK